MAPPRLLVLARHAKSSWKTNDPDVARPLSGRGTRDGVVAGATLANLDIDLALVSPATRARQTWQCHQMGGATAADVRQVDELYYGDLDDVLAILRELPDSARTVLVIGHEPLISDLALTVSKPNKLTRAIERKFPTSAIAALAHQGSWSDLDHGVSRLAAFEIPRG
ncbi:MAG: histidine phosphatase family protein [Propioniciclava sp.]|uniref:SixA phosphatase family protein n=1 Tax=Propioniciclava sp. TaxID=2038686 RepID=UPI0039E5C15E